MTDKARYGQQIIKRALCDLSTVERAHVSFSGRVSRRQGHTVPETHGHRYTMPVRWRGGNNISCPPELRVFVFYNGEIVHVFSACSGIFNFHNAEVLCVFCACSANFKLA